MLSLIDKLKQWRAASKKQQASQTTSSLQLIVGLGNPGSKYANTRHNAGARWVRELAIEHGIQLKKESRFQGELGRGSIFDREVRLLIPSTYMNLSGRSVSALIRYFKIPSEKMLVAHDEVAFATGIAKLKVGGGLNGHRGLESIVQSLGGNKEFARLRIGVGHPGDPNSLSAYLTQREMSPRELELETVSATIEKNIFEALLDCDMQRAMGQFHTSNP